MKKIETHVYELTLEEVMRHNGYDKPIHQVLIFKKLSGFYSITWSDLISRLDNYANNPENYAFFILDEIEEEW